MIRIGVAVDGATRARWARRRPWAALAIFAAGFSALAPGGGADFARGAPSVQGWPLLPWSWDVLVWTLAVAVSAATLALALLSPLALLTWYGWRRSRGTEHGRRPEATR